MGRLKSILILLLICEDMMSGSFVVVEWWILLFFTNSVLQSCRISRLPSVGRNDKSGELQISRHLITACLLCIKALSSRDEIFSDRCFAYWKKWGVDFLLPSATCSTARFFQSKCQLQYQIQLFSIYILLISAPKALNLVSILW